MRKILSEDIANAEARKGTEGGSRSPEAKIYIPNYREVNHIFMEAPGSASITFDEVLSKASLRMLQNQEKVYEGIERDSLLTDVNTQYQNKLQEFVNSNPSGRGYTQYATDTYSKLIESTASEASSVEVSQQIRALGQSNLKGIANSAVQMENQLSTAYVLSEKQKILETKYNNVLNDPDRFEGLAAEISASVADMEGVIPAKEYEKFRAHAMENFILSYGMGLTRKNPMQAYEYLKSEIFSGNLSHENYAKLIKYAEQKQKEQESNQYRTQKLVIMQERADSKLEIINVETAIELGTVGLADIESNDKLTSLDKQLCVKKFHEKNRQERLKEQSYEKMNEIWSKGGDISSTEEKYQKSRYSDMVRAKQDQLKGEGQVTGQEVSVTSVDKALIAMNFSYTNSDLRQELQSKMQQNDNIDDRINAAIALKYLMSQSPRTVGSIDQKYVNFANEVVNRTAINPRNKANIVENASARYLDESKSVEAADVSRKMREFMSRNTSKVDWFINHYDFNGSFFSRRRVEDKAQFEKDMLYETRNALLHGASNVGEAQDIAASRLKDYWKEVDDKYVRNPPQLMNPTLSEYALKNFIANGVKKAIIQLNKSNYSGAKFELKNDIIRPSSKSSDWYTKDLTVSKKPIIGIKIGEETFTKEVELESIPMKPGLYKMYCTMDDGSRYYIPSATNPLLHQTMRLGGDE